MAGDRGFLVPSRYVYQPPDVVDMYTASIVWGLSIGVTIFNVGKAAQQTKATWERKHRLTMYVTLIWAEVISSTILGAMVWLYLKGVIGPSFQFYFFIIVWWSTQVQCLIQIIINRVGLLMVVRSNATKLKWICFALLLCVNISVMCIWVPARLQISDTYIHINEIWDRCEKVIFAIIDAALNFYFIYVVKKRLISNGLHKYTGLYHMNLFLVVISISLDVLLIGMMSLPNSFVYVQFHPLVYLIKLHIEMNMADLISKVVRASRNPAAGSSNYNSRSRTYQPTSRTYPSRFAHTLTSAHHRTHIELGDDDEMEQKRRQNLPGIQKTVVTEIIRVGPNDEEQGVGSEEKLNQVET